jgi:[ribosomal protein S18]-alanine N-acetyltransferase
VNATLAPSRLPLPEVVWRPMRDDDIATVAVLEADAHPAPWTPGNFRDALAAGYAMTVGEVDGRIVAYGVLMLAPGEAQLRNLTVATALRRRGIGRRLLKRFVADALRFGAEQCFLEVRVSNLSAIALYAAEGFRPVARRAGYYPAASADAAREDALVLRRALREHPPVSA